MTNAIQSLVLDIHTTINHISSIFSSNSGSFVSELLEMFLGTTYTVISRSNLQSHPGVLSVVKRIEWDSRELCRFISWKKPRALYIYTNPWKNVTMMIKQLVNSFNGITFFWLVFWYINTNLMCMLEHYISNIYQLFISTSYVQDLLRTFIFNLPFFIDDILVILVIFPLHLLDSYWFLQ